MRAGISLQKRRNDTYGYVYTTSVENDQLIADVVRDPIKSGTVYALAYDKDGHDTVVEISSIADSAENAPGWDERGPLRPDKQPSAMRPDDSWCGTGLTGTGHCTESHPGGKSLAGWSVSEQTAHGWSGPGGYRRIVLDSSGTYTNVYAALNMWRPLTTVQNDPDPHEYHFRVYRWDGVEGPLASHKEGNHSYTYEPGDGNNWTLDAMAVNPHEGTLIYKATPKNELMKSIVGILHIQDDSLVSSTRAELTPPILTSTCESCANRRDAFRFNSATFSRSGDENSVIFVGSSRLEGDSDEGYYPSILKLSADALTFSGEGAEIYFNGASNDNNVMVPSSCEGIIDPRQGRFSTFTSVATNGEFGYVGASSVGCKHPDCALRSGCIWIFRLDFGNQEQLDAPVILSGGGPDGLGEMDVHHLTIMSDGTMNGGFLFALTGSSYTTNARIVKIEIGGSDVSSACALNCFRRVGSYLASEPSHAMVFIPEFTSLFSASMTVNTTTYRRYSTAEVISLSPKYGPASGANTVITVIGSGFPTDLVPTADKSHSTACRFGLSSMHDKKFPRDGWVPATVISSTRVLCNAPTASQVSLTLTDGPALSGYAEVELSFDGYPAQLMNSSELIYHNSLWTKDHIVYRYYSPPIATDVSIDGSSPPAVMITGEGPNQLAAIMTLRGGPFIDSGAGSLMCRFNDDVNSDQNATYLSATEITCPVCSTTSSMNGERARCSQLVNSGLDIYRRMNWLPDDAPRKVPVSFSLNGKDFHYTGSALTIFGQPHHVEVTHHRSAGELYYGSNTDSLIETYMTLDPVEVNIADINGFTMENDYGRDGETRGLTVRIELNETASPFATLSPDSVSGTTTDGKLVLTPKFSSAPVAGQYHFNFMLQDCTLEGQICADMPGVSTLIISVMPGIATQIIARPGHVSVATENQALPSDAIIHRATASMTLGAMFVEVMDAGNNRVGSLDGSSHAITVRSTTNTLSGILVGMLEDRLNGADLVGSQTMWTVNGIAEFRDLRLVSQEPTGVRAPGVTSNLTFGYPSRGYHGEDDIYWLQFSASLPGLASDDYAFSIAVLQIIPGKPVYLNISDYVHLEIACNSPQEYISTAIFVHMYDGGNNILVEDTEHRTVSVRSSGFPSLTISGLTEVTDVSGTGEWLFPASSIRLKCETVNSYGLEFVSANVQSIVQVVEMTKGTRGYQWRPVQIGQWFDLLSDDVVSVGSFELEVLDGAWNILGADDRYGAYTHAHVNRLVRCSSTTVELSSTSTAQTLGTGVAVFSELALIRPSAGSHIIKCSEYTNIINQVPEIEIASTEAGFVFLEGGEFTVTVVTGERKSLEVIQVGTNPVVDYSLSFGHVNAKNFRNFASADDIVPLDIFRVRAVDAGTNPVFGPLPSFNVSIRGTSSSNTRRNISASLSGVPASGYHPYITGRNVRLQREAVLVSNPLMVQMNNETGLSAEMLGDANEASIEKLALRRPPHGTFDLVFTTVPLDPMLASVSIQISVQPGRAHHLGIAAPCVYEYSPTVCDADSTLEDEPNMFCTCAVYNVSATVFLSPLRTYILDGGENALGSSHAPICDTSVPSCTGSKISMEYDPEVTGMCLLDTSGSPAADPDTSAIPSCASTQPSDFSGITVDGEFTFSNYALIAPKQASTSNPLLLSFSSPGLIGASFGLELRPGVAVKLGLVLPEQFPAAFKSNFTTTISSAASPIIVQILDDGGSPVGAFDTHSRKVSVKCDTSTLGTFPGGSSSGERDAVFTQRDIAYFGSLRLLSPLKGTHVVEFWTPDIESITLSIVVEEGEPVQLKVLSTTQTSYAAEPVMTIKPISVGVYDAGSNYVGSSNYIMKRIFANVTDGPFNDDGDPGYTQLSMSGENVELLQIGIGSVTFSDIKVRDPLVGTYNITFGGNDLVGDVTSFTVEVGSPYKLYVPDTHVMVSYTYRLFSFFSQFSNACLTPICIFLWGMTLHHV